MASTFDDRVYDGATVGNMYRGDTMQRWKKEKFITIALVALAWDITELVHSGQYVYNPFKDNEVKYRGTYEDGIQFDCNVALLKEYQAYWIDKGTTLTVTDVGGTTPPSTEDIMESMELLRKSRISNKEEKVAKGVEDMKAGRVVKRDLDGLYYDGVRVGSLADSGEVAMPKDITEEEYNQQRYTEWEED